jgi:hypothetical protein
MRSATERSMAGLKVTNYMRDKRKKTSKKAIPFPLFGKDFPEGGTRATLLKPEQEEELIEDVQLPDNLDEFLQYREGVQHNTDEQHGEPPLEGEDEEFTGELIYPEESEEAEEDAPENTNGRTARRTRVDYFAMHTGRPR